MGDTFNYTIRKITPDGVVTTFAGLAGHPGWQDGTGNQARFNRTWGVTVDQAGFVYVADEINNTIRKITPDGVVSTLAGSHGRSGDDDGTGSDVRFREPTGGAVDTGGNVYVSDNGNETVRKITPAGFVTTLAASQLRRRSHQDTAHPS